MDTIQIEVEFLSGPQDGELMSFRTNVVEIGREQGVHLPLSFDRLVSRRHARVVRDGEALSVEDLGSSYGTSVDGKRINGTKSINENNIICVGHTELAVRISNADATQKVATATESRASS